MATWVGDQVIALATCPQPATMIPLYLLGCGEAGAATELSKTFESSREKVVLIARGTVLSSKVLPVMTVPAFALDRSRAAGARMVSVTVRSCANTEFVTVIEY